MCSFQQHFCLQETSLQVYNKKKGGGVLRKTMCYHLTFGKKITEQILIISL